MNDLGNSAPASAVETAPTGEPPALRHDVASWVLMGIALVFALPVVLSHGSRRS